MHRGLVEQSQARSGRNQQRRSATRQQHKHQIARRQRATDTQDFLRGPHARLIRHRVRRFEDSDALQRNCVSGLDHDRAAVDARAQAALQTQRQRAGGLTSADNNRPAGTSRGRQQHALCQVAELAAPAVAVQRSVFT